MLGRWTGRPRRVGGIYMVTVSPRAGSPQHNPQTVTRVLETSSKRSPQMSPESLRLGVPVKFLADTACNTSWGASASSEGHCRPTTGKFSVCQIPAEP